MFFVKKIIFRSIGYENNLWNQPLYILSFKHSNDKRSELKLKHNNNYE